MVVFGDAIILFKSYDYSNCDFDISKQWIKQRLYIKMNKFKDSISILAAVSTRNISEAQVRFGKLVELDYFALSIYVTCVQTSIQFSFSDILSSFQINTSFAKSN